MAPVAVAKNSTVQLNATGTVTIAAADVNNGSTDNCGIASVTLDKTTFDCSNVGSNLVTLTVTDTSGNTHTATATVTVEDKTAPTLEAPVAVTVDVDAGKTTASNVALGTPVTADMCGLTSVTNDAPAEYMTGTTTVTWTARDGAGNTTTATQIVTVRTYIMAFTQPATVKVPIRTTFNNVTLPTTVEVTYNNNVKQNLSVIWNAGTYNGAVAGTYELAGTLTLAPGTTNQNNVGIKMMVEVEPNKVPTALALSKTTFNPNILPTEFIGTLTTTDADDTQHTYTLVTGQGNTDNNLFELKGNALHLKSNEGLSGKTQFSIRVRTTDPYSNSFEQTFTLNKGQYAKAVADLKIVNTFTPNGDGMNDDWTIPELKFYNQVEIEVFDRSGVRLFHTTDPEKGWDGKDQNGLVRKGSYLYVVQVKDINLVKKGVVSILKK
jgi:gliding motility-associated-like protein